MEDDEMFSDSWVTEAKAFEFSGLVEEATRDERDVKGEKALYLNLNIKPTNYEGEPIKAQYRVSKSRNGKWIPFI